MTSLKSNWALVAVCAAILLTALLLINYRPEPALGSVARLGEYQSTTTSQGRFANDVTLCSGPCTLGSIVITGPASGYINFYDATTTDITKRTGQTATSTLLVASLPLNASSSTYTLDLNVYTALQVSIVGTIPTTTITYRQ